MPRAGREENSSPLSPPRYASAVHEPEEDPPEEARESVAPPARRAPGEARTPANDPVTFTAEGRTVDGWTLNRSAGGLRVVLEDEVTVGECFVASVGESGGARPVRVVWVRSAKGGIVAGVAFEDVEDGMPPEDTVS